MLDTYFEREDILSFVYELKTNKCYYQKSHSFYGYDFPVFSELALYIFYDALLKYKIIIDSMDLLPRYLEQLHKLYRKVDSFDELRFSIHKLIVRMASSHYDVMDYKDDGREELITIIYNKYVEKGYLFHGIHGYYKEDIVKNGFVPGFYENYYERFMNINTIFHKYTSIVPIMKDFSLREVDFCDDALLGCYYSMYSPFYFYQFLTNQRIMGKKISYEDYLKDNYVSLNHSLKRYMDNNLFDDRDKDYIINLMKDEWSLLRQKEKRLCLLCVPRSKVIKKEIPLDRYLESELDVFEVIDRILSSKYNNVRVDQIFSSDSLEMVTFPPYYERMKDNSSQEKKSVENNGIFNKYGSVSFILLLGSLFVSLGVILTIINFLGGYR